MRRHHPMLIINQAYAYAQRSKNHARVIIQIPMLHTRLIINKKWQSRDNLGILRFVYAVTTSSEFLAKSMMVIYLINTYREFAMTLMNQKVPSDMYIVHNKNSTKNATTWCKVKDVFSLFK